MGMTHRPRSVAGKQAAASVGQGILLAHYTSRFASHGLRVGQVLLTVNDLVRPTSYRNAWSTLDTLLELGVVPIVNENDTVATGEIKFGDNDRLAALVAELTSTPFTPLIRIPRTPVVWMSSRTLTRWRSTPTRPDPGSVPGA